MATPTRRRSRFGEQLHRQLEAHATIKSVRQLSRVMNPQNPEVTRRALGRWIVGKNAPNLANRERVADALEVDVSVFSDDDDEESSMTLDEFLRLRIEQMMREAAATVRESTRGAIA